jgi:hypothetical protein
VSFSALPLDIHFAGAAQQKYQIRLIFVSIFRIELLPCGAIRMQVQKATRAGHQEHGAPALFFPSAFRRRPP